MRLRTPTLLLIFAALAISLALYLRSASEADAPKGLILAGNGELVEGDGSMPAQRTSTPLRPAPEPEPAPVKRPSTLNSEEALGSTDGEVVLRSRPVTQRRVELTTQLDALLAVRVVSSATGSPLEGVRAIVYLESPEPGEMVPDRPSGNSRGGLGASATTDARGYAELAVPSGKDLRLALVDEVGVGTRASHRLRALKSKETRELELPMARGGDQFFLRVLSRRTGEPISGCSAYFADQLTPGSVRAAPDALDNGEGMLRLDITPETPDWAWVNAPGHANLRVRIGPGHDRPVNAREVTLPLASNLRVQLLGDDGAPAREVVVEVTLEAESVAAAEADARGTEPARWIARTTPSGWARFARLVPDVPISIKVRASGDRTWPSPAPQILSPGESRDLTLRRTPGVTLEGRLVAMQDTRVADLLLWILPATRQEEQLLQRSFNARVWAEVRTDDQGRYRIEDVPPGEWWIGPAPQSFEISLGGPPPAPRAVWIRVPDDRQSLEIDLEVRPALWLTGQVETAKGFPAGRQRLWGKPVGGGEGIVGWSDSEGRFRIGPVTAGTYELAVDAAFAHAGSAPVVLDAGAEPVSIRLRGGATIQGVAFDPDGLDLEPLAVLVTTADGSLQRLADLDIQGLADGVHGVFVQSAAGRVGMAADVAAKSGRPPTEVLITMEQPAELLVRVFGQYRVWKDAVCVGEGVAGQGAPLTLLVPAGDVELERVEDEGSRTKLKLVAGERHELAQ